ncbi:hypothetical protein GCM10009527_075970 [Actinomadura nitritigenes]
MPAITAWKCGASPRCPVVTTGDNGICPCSQARYTFIDDPPRERPSELSAGAVTVPPGGSR